jgi:hypothetical protein
MSMVSVVFDAPRVQTSADLLPQSVQHHADFPTSTPLAINWVPVACHSPLLSQDGEITEMALQTLRFYRPRPAPHKYLDTLLPYWPVPARTPALLCAALPHPQLPESPHPQAQAAPKPPQAGSGPSRPRSGPDRAKCRRQPLEKKSPDPAVRKMLENHLLS